MRLGQIKYTLIHTNQELLIQKLCRHIHISKFQWEQISWCWWSIATIQRFLGVRGEKSLFSTSSQTECWRAVGHCWMFSWSIYLDMNPTHKCHDCFAMWPNVHLSGDIQVFCFTRGNPVQTASRGNDTVPIIFSRSSKGKLALTSLLSFWEENFRFPSSGVESCAWLRPSSREVLSFHNKTGNNPPPAKDHPTMSLAVWA